jgi:methylmalonyl-CoA mutase N-terminal domain/subunit
MDKIETMGGAVQAIEQGFVQEEIAQASYRHQQRIESNEKIIVGVNQFVHAEELPEAVFTVDDSIRLLQIEKLKSLRSKRNQIAVEEKLLLLKQHAAEGRNVMPVVVEAVEALATLGEISDVLRSVYGEYR